MGLSGPVTKSFAKATDSTPRTLGRFEAALGRRLPWSFEGHELYLVPEAFELANAYYSPDNKGIVFGYFSDSNGDVIHTCLSHDIIAHETTHAILDGMRSRFFLSGLPDQLAFHEGLADLVALLSAFAIPQVVESAIERASGQAANGTNRVFEWKSVEDGALFGIAEQFGQAMSDGHRKFLRESVKLAPGEVPKDWVRNEDWQEPHKRGEIIVAAVTRVLAKMWKGRIDVLANENPSPQLILEEGAKSADHLLGMLIRALDYLPPVEFEIEDFLDALLWSDLNVSPDDEHRYRDAIESAFNDYHIKQPDGHPISFGRRPPTLRNMNFGEFLIHSDEVYRYLWQNAEELHIEAREYATKIIDVQPSIRVGPNGLVVHETLAAYVQNVEGKLGDLVKHSELHNAAHAQTQQTNGAALVQAREALDIPPGMDEDIVVQLWGGGVLIFDPFGRPKFIQHKDLCDWKRQNARLRRLAAENNPDQAGRYGFGDPTASGRFQLHQLT
jgi:hypothetical protein